MAVIVDTNVAVVANGPSPEANETCEAECARRLAQITRDGGLLLDDLGLIVAEYVKQLGFAGKPGAGRAFVKWAHDNRFVNGHCTLVPITRCLNTDWRRFKEFPNDPELSGFDASDQKFVAVAVASGAQPRILNAVDSDWWEHRAALDANGIAVEFLCPEQFGEG